MKLIYIPLAFLLTFSLLSMLGLGSDIGFGTVTVGSQITGDGLYDDTGHLVVNSTLGAVGEAGKIFAMDYSGAAAWDNVTTDSTTYYPLYYDEAATDPVFFTQINGAGSTGIGANLGTSLGLIGLVVGIMALALLAGVHVLGSGVSDESVSTIIKGTFFLVLWGAASVMSLSLITSVPFMGPVFYFVLTAIYTLGIINQIGHPGDD